MDVGLLSCGEWSRYWRIPRSTIFVFSMLWRRRDHFRHPRLEIGETFVEHRELTLFFSRPISTPRSILSACARLFTHPVRAFRRRALRLRRPIFRGSGFFPSVCRRGSPRRVRESPFRRSRSVHWCRVRPSRGGRCSGAW
jgi:hypothetical protein